MGTARVTITIEGLEQVITSLTEIGAKSEQSLVKLTKKLSDDGRRAWKDVTPRGKTGRLQGEERAEPSGLSITFSSPTRYYGWVDAGHWTPRGWRTKRGFRLAKHRSHVAGREMTPKLVEWLTENTPEYLSKFLEDA